MKEYVYDVFLSFTGADRELKTYIRENLEERGLKCYDADRDCKGDFTDNFCQALDQSKVYLMILSDNLCNNPAESGQGWLTYVRDECAYARELESANELNIEILCMPGKFSFNTTFHDYTDSLRWFFYTHTRGFSMVHGAVNEEGNLSGFTLNKIYHDCRDFIIRRDAGKPVISQHFNVYIRNVEMPEKGVFKGREEEINAALDAFKAGKQVVVLRGLGGFGKTTLATEIARESEARSFLNCPQIVYLQDIIQKTSFSNSNNKPLSELVSSVTYSERVYDNLQYLAEADKYEHKLNALRKLPETVLLVIDNYNTLSQYDINNLLFNLKCRILITTRSMAEIESSKVEILPNIDKLDKSLAYEMFCENHGGKVDAEEFSLLYDSVGGHTITLCIMAKMMAVHDMSIAGLREEMAELGKGEAKVSFYHNEHRESSTVLGHLTNLFRISDFDDDEKCQKILRAMSLISDGTINVKTLISVLKLRNRNEINNLIESGWLESRKITEDDTTTEYIYLHPILSALMANLLVPTAENSSEMVDYLISLKASADEDISYIDAMHLEEQLFYACYVLAGGCQRLSQKLWERFVQINHLLGDVEGTSRKIQSLLPRLSDESEKKLVSVYVDTVTIEQYPTKVEIIDKYVETLEQNVNDYMWVIRSLSVTLPHVMSVEKHKPALMKALDKAMTSAMLARDDFGVYELLSYHLAMKEDITDVLKKAKAYAKMRKKEGDSSGTLTLLEYMKYIFSMSSAKKSSEFVTSTRGLLDKFVNGSDFENNLFMIRHPVFFYKSNKLAKKLEETEPQDLIDEYLQIAYGSLANSLEKGEIEVADILEMAIIIHTYRLERNSTLASAGEVVMNLINVVRSVIPDGILLKNVNLAVGSIDMSNITVNTLSQLQVAALVNSVCENKAAIEQSRQVVEAIRRLRPEGHVDVIHAMVSHADVCASLGDDVSAFKTYAKVFALLVNNNPDSVILPRVARSILEIRYALGSEVKKLIRVRDAALSDLEETAPIYYRTLENYANRLFDSVYLKKIDYNNKAFEDVWCRLHNATALLDKMNVFTQRTVLLVIVRLIFSFVRRKQFESAEKLREILAAFKKSKKKTIRTEATFFLLYTQASVMKEKGDEAYISLYYKATKISVKYHIYLGDICVMFLELYTAALKNGKHGVFETFIKKPKYLQKLESLQHDAEVLIKKKSGCEEDVLSDGQILKQIFEQKLKNQMGIKSRQFKKLRTPEDFYFKVFENGLNELINLLKSEKVSLKIGSSQSDNKTN